MTIDEIKSLIYSDSTPNKSVGYSTLLHLQQQSSDDLSLLQILTDASQSLIPAIVIDVSDDDEEISAQALKCLGFLIYHPSIVSLIRADDVTTILEALAKVILSTQIKSVCNLGVWCISMQQFNTSFLDASFQSLLSSVVHALDNPHGSLSTSFEAMQAVMKLAAQLSEKMRESAHVWAPPIYRRLISMDKREREIAERCLLKIRETVFPPTAALYKGLVEDLKSKLLAGMNNLLNQGMKVQAMRAWGWFIRLLGSNALKNKHLINNMLKIPEQTFSDSNPQIQISSLVAWESLIDALVYPLAFTCEGDGVMENGIQQVQISGGNSRQVLARGQSKPIKLIMTPLMGIISSKCDNSVHLSCLNTWSYLLHKLDTFICHPTIIELVLDPVFNAILNCGPGNKTVWLWNLCIDMLDDFLRAKCLSHREPSSQVSHHSSFRMSVHGSSMSSITLWKYPIKWLPCPIVNVDLFLKVISIIISHASISTSTVENRSSACNASLRVFKSLLKRVKMELKIFSIDYQDIMFCLNTILRFVKKISEDVYSEGNVNDQLYLASLQFIEATIEELEPFILGSPLYKVALDLKSIEKLNTDNDRCKNFLGIRCVAHMDMASPLVYLVVLYICLLILSTSSTEKAELILPRLSKFFKFLFLTCDSEENLLIINGLLYRHALYRCLPIWVAVAEGLKECIDDLKGLSLLKMEIDCNGSLYMCHLLLYPFAVCLAALPKFGPGKDSDFLEISPTSVGKTLELKDVTKAWMSLYGSFCASNLKTSAVNSISENLFSLLNECLDNNEYMLVAGAELGSNYKDLYNNLLSLSGNAVTCVLEQIFVVAAASENKNKVAIDAKLSIGTTCRLGFASRLMKMSVATLETDPSTALFVASRVFSALARIVSCLCSTQAILSLTETITCPLLQWLSREEMQDGNTNVQLQNLWAEILQCMMRSQPPIVFDSSFLKLQAPLLEKTLDHPNPNISAQTLLFWNSTYGKRIDLDYPESLLDLLDKLSNNKRINLHKKSLPFLVKCHTIPDLASQRYKVAATNTRSSKRVEFVESAGNQYVLRNNLCSTSKRKRLELTEHQKEVRRAQQGRGMDCSGHGPGIRTYTSVDFSQGNEDSQESQGNWNLESVPEIRRRVI